MHNNRHIINCINFFSNTHRKNMEIKNIKSTLDCECIDPTRTHKFACLLPNENPNQDKGTFYLYAGIDPSKNSYSHDYNCIQYRSNKHEIIQELIKKGKYTGPHLCLERVLQNPIVCELNHDNQPVINIICNYKSDTALIRWNRFTQINKPPSPVY